MERVEQMSDKELAVGIDLGTTFSAVAFLDSHGRPQTLINAEGDKLTPSVMLFDGGTVVVGKEAVKAMGSDFENVADCPKRDLGERAYHKVLGDRQYPPEALQAWILRKLRSDAERQIGPFKKAVITVPAYFDEVRRKATMDAGYMAGLEVIDIINEPTAAAIAFGVQQGFLNDQGMTDTKKRILVYDLGGGTFDVTVMEIEGDNYNAIATDGDMRLGGRDWDQRLVDFVAEELIRTHGIDPREDPNNEGKLWRECEDAKRTLSVRERAKISLEIQGQSVKVEVTREDFENMSRDLLDRTMFTTKQTLQQAKLDWSDIDMTLLVGGSTRMPCVAEELKRVSGKEPQQSISPDEAVAFGAAIRAGLVLADKQGEKTGIRIKNVNSHSLVVVGIDSETKRPRNGIVIPRNTPLPVVAKRVFLTTKANQRSILVQIVEGESTNPADCSQIGKCTVRELPLNLPAKTPIEVRFKYEENGRLMVVVQVKGAEKVLKHELTRENSLTKEQMDGWKDFIEQSSV